MRDKLLLSFGSLPCSAHLADGGSKDRQAHCLFWPVISRIAVSRWPLRAVAETKFETIRSQIRQTKQVKPSGRASPVDRCQYEPRLDVATGSHERGIIGVFARIEAFSPVKRRVAARFQGLVELPWKAQQSWVVYMDSPPLHPAILNMLPLLHFH